MALYPKVEKMRNKKKKTEIKKQRRTDKHRQ